MWVHPNERHHLARYLHALMLGEYMAARCASTQAQIVPPRLRRFFKVQARQEKVHATVFQGAVQWLAPKGTSYRDASSLMQQYQVLIDDAIQRRDLPETVLAMQVMLESLGEVCLHRLDQGCAKRGLGFRRLRHIVLNQERAHHHFGQRQLEVYTAMADGEQIRQRLQARAADYGALIDQLVVAFQGAFDCFDEDIAAFQHDVQKGYAAWLVNPQ